MKRNKLISLLWAEIYIELLNKNVLQGVKL